MDIEYRGLEYVLGNIHWDELFLMQCAVQAFHTARCRDSKSQIGIWSFAFSLE